MRAATADFKDYLACPACRANISFASENNYIDCEQCGKRYPVVHGVPLLLDEARSVFDVSAILNNAEGDSRSDATLFRKLLRRATPSITANWSGKHNMKDLAERLLRSFDRPKILVVGAGDGGAGVQTLLRRSDIVVISTDIFLGREVDVVADGHDLPFQNNSFDSVIMQAVLEHVAEPFRCVDEALRVLRTGGLVYAETPFLYPGHLGAYDFHRFTVTGRRRLFRRFAQLHAGVGAGPGTAAALGIQSLIASFSTAHWYRLAILNALPFLLFWLKYIDLFVAQKPSAVDFACTLFFLGEKSSNVLSDREVISTHWSENSPR